MSDPRFLVAGNEGPFTLDGTRTYLVGRGRVAVVDPGPDLAEHVEAVTAAVGNADSVAILLTHGHADHAGAARALAARLSAPDTREGGRAPLRAPRVYGPQGIDVVDEPLTDGMAVDTDEGPLVAVHTPGHTPDHLCFHWPERRALFAGDLLLGLGDTTWVADYPGCVADYLASLGRLRELDVAVAYPAHGPPLRDVPAALDRFGRHRRARIAQVERALAERPDATVEDLLDMVYGRALPQSMRWPASRSIEALVEHVRGGAGRY